MAPFRHSPTGQTIINTTLHAGNSGVYFYFKGDDRGREEFECKSQSPAVVKVESVKMNNEPQGIRQVTLAAKGVGMTTVSCSSGSKQLGLLSVTVVLKINLPAKGLDAGLIARVLLSEARGPWMSGYSEPGARKSMEWMHLVLHNRLNNKPELFGARDANTLSDIVKAKGQFKGFESYPTLTGAVEKRINDTVDGANNDNHAKQEQFVKFVNNAITVANKSAPVGEPATPDILAFWRTEGSGSPGGSAKLHESVGGITFYKMKKPK